MWKSNSNTLVPDHDLEPQDESPPRIHPSRLEYCPLCNGLKMKGKQCGHCNGKGMKECERCGCENPALEECQNCRECGVYGGA